jgi:hypothetical protein
MARTFLSVCPPVIQTGVRGRKADSVTIFVLAPARLDPEVAFAPVPWHILEEVHLTSPGTCSRSNNFKLEPPVSSVTRPHSSAEFFQPSSVAQKLFTFCRGLSSRTVTAGNGSENRVELTARGIHQYGLSKYNIDRNHQRRSTGSSQLVRHFRTLLCARVLADVTAKGSVSASY